MEDPARPEPLKGMEAEPRIVDDKKVAPRGGELDDESGDAPAAARRRGFEITWWISRAQASGQASALCPAR